MILDTAVTFFLFRKYQESECGASVLSNIDWITRLMDYFFLTTPVILIRAKAKIAICAPLLMSCMFFSRCSAHPFWTISLTMTGSCHQSTTSLTHMLRCRSVYGQQRAHKAISICTVNAALISFIIS